MTVVDGLDPGPRGPENIETSALLFVHQIRAHEIRDRKPSGYCAFFPSLFALFGFPAKELRA